MNAPSGPSRPLNSHQAQSNPAVRSNMANSFALGNIRPGERMPMSVGPRTISGPPPPTVQPGQVFRHPGYNAASPGPALRSTTNPVRPGMMVQPMPVYRQPGQAPSTGPYPLMPQRPPHASGMPYQSLMPQPRSVTAPVQPRQPGPQRYELHDRVSSHPLPYHFHQIHDQHLPISTPDRLDDQTPYRVVITPQTRAEAIAYRLRLLGLME
jgi:hypothetical protein